ncbi:MAG: cupin domain-containing protein [Thermoleophilaceae bacterium]|nr:cupin domain-containing protein [Thermoleophilaceae bacterium]
MLDEVPEARLVDTDAGKAPDGEGWFVVNVAEASGMHTDRFGAAARFEGAARFPELGINVRVLQPGQSAGLYHRENAQEGCLVLSGECVAIVEDEERPMRAGDYLHLPPGAAHVVVGAGDGPCALVMVGVRKAEHEVLYPVSERASRYGASVERETADPAAAYAGVTRTLGRLGRVPWEGG